MGDELTMSSTAGMSALEVSAQSHKDSHENQPDCSDLRRMNTEVRKRWKRFQISELEDHGECGRMSAEASTGGRGEIRTHEGAKPPAGFQDRCLKPLGHPSIAVTSAT